MMLAAYAMATMAQELQVWLGVFDGGEPPQLSFTLDAAAALPAITSPIRPMRDSGTVTGKTNYRGLYKFTGLQPARPYRIGIRCPCAEPLELVVTTLPAEIPQSLEGTFNVLLCSCYSQHEDKSGLVNTIVSQIKVQPHLTLLVGDQIYGDLPLLPLMPDTASAIAQSIGEKYRRNWTMAQSDAGGLGAVLSRAPIACIADDHEFWNNFPFAQAQLPATWMSEHRQLWKQAATALHEDYQLAGSAGGTQQIDVEPLSFLLVDMRSGRDEQFRRLMPEATLQALRDWVDGLVKSHDQGRPRFGVLVSGQPLLVDAAPEVKRVLGDAQMANYAQFNDDVLGLFDALADKGLPLLYLTGDVHWGRVAQGFDGPTDRVLLHEIISSPACLCGTPVLDAGSELLNVGKSLFGSTDPWPRHPTPATVPSKFGHQRRFIPQCDLDDGSGFAQRGDQVAIISFERAGQGVNFKVTYYPITQDKVVGRSRTTRTYELRIN